MTIKGKQAALYVYLVKKLGENNVHEYAKNKYGSVDKFLHEAYNNGKIVDDLTSITVAKNEKHKRELLRHSVVTNKELLRPSSEQDVNSGELLRGSSLPGAILKEKLFLATFSTKYEQYLISQFL